VVTNVVNIMVVILALKKLRQEHKGNFNFFQILFLKIYLFILVFQDRVSLYSCPGTHFVDQAGLELRNPPASASQVLGLRPALRLPGAKHS
jgi:hypothetical protein